MLAIARGSEGSLHVSRHERSSPNAAGNQPGASGGWSSTAVHTLAAPAVAAVSTAVLVGSPGSGVVVWGWAAGQAWQLQALDAYLLQPSSSGMVSAWHRMYGFALVCSQHPAALPWLQEAKGE